ncbi:hypothetical protein ACFOW1_07930 [Parasediminibacterium paludis]|uniref:Uncharacterized protein n=1 Tax=Parasediminibacterium paludis TaxID=908966 RepID=A0ABV8PX58_9BACT
MNNKFGNIELPDFVLVDFFRDNLVIVNDIVGPPNTQVVAASQSMPADTTISPAIKKTSLPVPKKWFLGDNQKHIVILVNDIESVYLRDEWLQFLSNILGACKLNLGDVAIVNHANNSMLFADFQQQLAPKHFILFDVATQQIQLPFTMPFYQLQQFGSTQFLLAPSLALMLGNTDAVKMEKSRLWLSLKKMFNI